MLSHRFAYLLPVRVGFLLTGLLLIGLQPPQRLQVWQYEEGNLHLTAISAPLEARLPLDAADLNGDGRVERLRLEAGRASIENREGTLWVSPAEWRVVQAELADLNHDRQMEAALLVWRAFQPWPIDSHLPNAGRIADFQNAAGLSCHLILIGWYRGEFRERWAGSALAEPLKSFLPVDLDGDGWEELAALEAFYDDLPGRPARALAVWQWNGFGFDLQARQRGRFLSLSAAKNADGDFLLLSGK